MSDMAHIIERLNAIQDDVKEVKGLAEATNGRVRKMEIWKAEMRGAKRAVGWVPPFATALASSAFSVLLYSIFLTH